MADLSTLQARLTEAETAYHALLTGTRQVEADFNGVRVKYTATDAGKLAAYIGELKAQIAAAGGTVTGLRRGAIVVDL